MHITYRPETKFLITTSNVLIFTNSGSDTPCRRKKQHYLCKELSSTLVIFTIFNVPSNTPGIVFCIQCNVWCTKNNLKTTVTTVFKPGWLSVLQGCHISTMIKFPVYSLIFLYKYNLLKYTPNNPLYTTITNTMEPGAKISFHCWVFLKRTSTEFRVRQLRWTSDSNIKTITTLFRLFIPLANEVGR